MSIDWVTVVAQLANFLLLVWLLKRFLYRPILDGIDAREAEIARRLASAEEARVQALAAEEDFLRRHEQVASERDAVVAQALQVTEQERDQILVEARALRAQEQKEWQRHLDAEHAEFVQRLQQAGALTLLELTRKVMHDLADAPLEAAIARHAGRQLAPLAGELAAAAGDSKLALLSTHAALDEAAKTQVREEFARLLPGVQLRFAVDDTQAPGLVVQLGAARAAWTLESFMDGLDEAVLQDQAACLAARRPGSARAAAGAAGAAGAAR
ncbi:MAG: F0F1 ATP synthase subunit B [Rubrivivax sp. SCN 71-131]|jgi:F-type H+-transporting ATPase subunit b|nr:MAG: F0F1 ATP synthase subunit B [Rubrivivax sp. SCN 71-131]